MQEWRDECAACFDTGWQTRTCAGGLAIAPTDQHGTAEHPWHYREASDGRPTCGRTKPHLPHDYVEPCACRPTNRTYQRHHGGL